MKKLVLLLLFLCFFLVSGCSKVQVSQDFDNEFKFDTEKSYAWNRDLQEKQGGLLSKNELLAKRFTKAIEENLQMQGFTISDDAPSFLVSCSYVVNSKIQSTPVSTGIGYGTGRYGRYGTVGIHSGTALRQYEQGRFTVSFHTASSGELVWRGTGTREVFTHSKPEQITKAVEEMVTEVLKQFPPHSQ